jgi:LytS/YehU family sensor histidine kinase
MLDLSTDDASWIYTLDPRSNFSNLSPGSYRFEVQAQDEEGQWSEATHWEFTILPPWWQTAWFRLLVLAVLGGLGFWGYKYRTGQLKRAFAIKQQIFELERSALQAQMNPHFIFNCLNSIQSFIAANDKDRAATFLAQFARLIRQTLEHSFQKEITLEDEIEYLHNYLSLEHLRFRDTFQYNIHVDEHIDLYDTVAPSMLVQPFVENAIVHGMKGKQGDGRIEVRFERINEAGLRITVEDNGSGQEGAPTNDSGESVKRTSYGVQLARRRLELAMQYPNSTIQTIASEGGGTRVEIVLM